MRKFGTLKEKRGSVAVLLSIIFTGFVIVTAILLIAARSAADRSMADAALRTAGRSVLSEYDQELFSRYGLLAFRGDGADVEEAIRFYTEASFVQTGGVALLMNSPENTIELSGVDVESVNVNLKEFSVMNVDFLEAQIREASISGLVESLFEKKPIVGEDESAKGRTLKNKTVIDTLPSKGLSGGAFAGIPNLLSLPSMNKVVAKGTNEFLTSEYVLSAFTNKLENHDREKSFFDNEVEYIIAGKMSDKENLSSVKTRIFALFSLLNMGYLSQDTERLEKVRPMAMALAASIEGMTEDAARAAIVAAWAVAESENDLRRLMKGEKVAFPKNHNQWATTDFLGAYFGMATSKIVEPADKNGFMYKDYLRALLYLENRETKLLRILDLIQINMKGSYKDDFLVREYYVGFRFDAVVNGDEFSYAEKY